MERLARLFSRLLLAEIGISFLEEVVLRNLQDPGVCHSYDFCDSERLMNLAADELCIQDDTVIEQAWDLAISKRFWLA